jgi:hypothetical protein
MGDAGWASPGDVIQLSAAPDANHTLKEWQTTTGGNLLISNDLTFAMPAYAVTLKAVFEPLPIPDADDFAIGADPVFDGSPKPASVTPKTGVGNILKIYYDGSETPPTDAGSFALSADVAQSDSFASAEGISLGTYTVKKAKALCSPQTIAAKEKLAKDYGIPLEDLIPAEVLSAGKDVDIKLEIEDRGGVFSSAPTISGSTIVLPVADVDYAPGLKASATLKASCKNYEDLEVSLTVEITQKIPVAVTFDISSGTYNKRPFEVSGLKITSGSGLEAEEVSPLCDVAYHRVQTGADGEILTDGQGRILVESPALASAPVDAGAYFAVVSVLRSDPDFAGSRGKVFRINPAPLVLRAKDVSIKAGEALPDSYAYEVEGLAEGDDESGALAAYPALSCPTGDNASVGEHAIIVSGGEAASNYSIASRVNGTLRVEANPDAPSIMTLSLASGKAGEAYSAALAASGAPAVWNVKSGKLPDGLALSPSTGVISGAPTESGSFSFEVEAKNYAGADSKTLALAIEPADPIVEEEPPVITATSLPEGKVGEAYAAVVAASGGQAEWSVKSGRLPSGVALDPATGALAGVPEEGGSFTFSAEAKNGAGSAERAFTLVIAPADPSAEAPSITTSSLPNGRVGLAYRASLEASNDPAEWAVVSGSLPPGASLDPATGVVSGTPARSGSFVFVVEARNSAGSDARTLALEVAPAAANPVYPASPPSYYSPARAPAGASVATPAPEPAETAETPEEAQAFTPIDAAPEQRELYSAQTLNRLGLLAGTGVEPSGKPVFSLDKTLTRIEALVLVIRLAGAEREALGFEGPNPFADVPGWADRYAAYARGAGIAAGVNEEHTLLDAERPVTRQEFTAFLLRVLQYFEKDGDFEFSLALRKAHEINLYPEPMEEGESGGLLRGDAAVAMARALLTPLNGSGAELIEKLVEQGAVDKKTAEECRPLLEKMK